MDHTENQKIIEGGTQTQRDKVFHKIPNKNLRVINRRKARRYNKPKKLRGLTQTDIERAR
jgi:hypothetical protein